MNGIYFSHSPPCAAPSLPPGQIRQLFHRRQFLGDFWKRWFSSISLQVGGERRDTTRAREQATTTGVSVLPARRRAAGRGKSDRSSTIGACRRSSRDREKEPKRKRERRELWSFARLFTRRFFFFLLFYFSFRFAFYPRLLNARRRLARSRASPPPKFVTRVSLLTLRRRKEGNRDAR